MSGGIVGYVLTTGDLYGTNPLMIAPYSSPINFALQSASRMIDAGTSQTIVSNDFFGAFRPQGAAFDIGAAEFTSDPAITVQPTDQTVTRPATATFSVTATGLTTLSYQWYKNGVSIGGATSAGYTTPATTAMDDGSTFYVIVTDTAGSVQSVTVTLHVNNPLFSGGGALKTYGRGTHGKGTH